MKGREIQSFLNPKLRKCRASRVEKKQTRQLCAVNQNLDSITRDKEIAKPSNVGTAESHIAKQCGTQELITPAESETYSNEDQIVSDSDSNDVEDDKNEVSEYEEKRLANIEENQFVLYRMGLNVSKEKAILVVMQYLNYKKFSDVDFSKLKKIGKKFGVSFDRKTTKDELLRLVGNNLLKNNYVTLKDGANKISRSNLVIVNRKIIEELTKEEKENMSKI